MKDFFGVTGEQSDALFETIYSFLGLCECGNSWETVEHKGIKH